MDIEKLKYEAQNKALHIADVSGSALFNADCMDILPLIPDKSIQLILADLPYGTTSAKWDCVLPLDLLWQQYERIITDNGSILLFGGQPFTSALIMSNLKMYKCVWYWKKEKGVGFTFAKFMPMRQIEEIVVFCKGKSVYNPIMIPLDKPYKHVLPRRKAETLSDCNITTCKNGESVYKEYTHKYPTNILEFARESTKRNVKYSHPTLKPLNLIKYLISTYSNENDTVLDNTMGSGTTCVAAKELNRKFIGIEKEVKYYDLAVARMFGQHCH